MNKRGQLIVYSGPSGVGKGTLLRPLIDRGQNLALSVSATTREPRPGEEEGRDYYFVSKQRFQQMIDQGEVLEYAVYNGNFYGTPKKFVTEQLDRGISVVLEIEVKGAMQVKESFPQALFVFVMPPSYEELERRLVGRGTETRQQVEGRLKAAKEEISFAKEYDFIIVNDDLEEAKERLSHVLMAGRQIARLNKQLIEEVLGIC